MLMDLLRLYVEVGAERERERGRKGERAMRTRRLSSLPLNLDGPSRTDSLNPIKCCAVFVPIVLQIKKSVLLLSSSSPTTSSSSSPLLLSFEAIDSMPVLLLQLRQEREPLRLGDQSLVEPLFVDYDDLSDTCERKERRRVRSRHRDGEERGTYRLTKFDEELLNELERGVELDCKGCLLEEEGFSFKREKERRGERRTGLIDERNEIERIFPVSWKGETRGVLEGSDRHGS